MTLFLGAALTNIVGKKSCQCKGTAHNSPLIVVTGGPGAGKTAVVKLAQQLFCRHIGFVPEAASIIFSGGFWRLESPVGKKSAQRAIYHVQREMESLVTCEPHFAACVCDRGTIDGLAYWPDSEESFWREVGTDLKSELHRYAAVIHLQTPSAENGYNHVNPVRTETADSAKQIDQQISYAWRDHPNRIIIPAHLNFMEKAHQAIAALRKALPTCCADFKINTPPT